MVFDKYTKKNVGNRGYRFLLVDRYCNHVKLDFFDYTDKYQITVLVLLPYTTYQFQLLDIETFSLLSKVYS